MSEETRREELEEVQGVDTAHMVPLRGPPSRATGREPYDLTSRRFAPQLRTAGSPSANDSVSELLMKLIRATRGQAQFQPYQATVTTSAQQLLTQQMERTYFFIQNTSVAGNLYLGVGYIPNSVTGILIQPNGGYYEPLRVPINEIFVVASATIQVLVLYSIGN